MINRFLLGGVALAALVVSSSDARAGEPRTIIGLDISGSSTFAEDTSSARAAALYVEEYVRDLSPPHNIQIVSVGTEGLGALQIDVRVRVENSRRGRPKRVARAVGGLVASIPSLVDEGRVKTQMRTSLLAFFEGTSDLCDGQTTIILFSDGLETGRTSPSALASGKGSLPLPRHRILEGCRVEMLGVGSQKASLNSQNIAQRLAREWTGYLRAAGADPIKVRAQSFGSPGS